MKHKSLNNPGLEQNSPPYNQEYKLNNRNNFFVAEEIKIS